MRVALCTLFGAQRHIHTFPAVLDPQEMTLTGAWGAPGAKCTGERAGATLPGVTLDPRSGQKPQNVEMTSRPFSVVVAFYRIYSVERHSH